MNITPKLLDEASAVFRANHENRTAFSKCLFLSWYCSVNDCNFCYRSTIKKAEDPSKMRRTLGSIFVEGFLAKQLGYELEFVTGGYGIYPIREMVEITKVMSIIFGEKIWINLGVLGRPALEAFKPYVKGVVASIETINPELRSVVCPSKPLEGYEMLYRNAGDDFEKSCAFIVGLGESAQDLELLHEWIRRHELSQITFYALKPVKGTPYTKGPDIEYYAWWVAKTRIAFPQLRIIAGITGRRAGDAGMLLRAGANVITKFPAFRSFGSDEAVLFERQLKESGRECSANLSVLPERNWTGLIDDLAIDESYKVQMKEVLPRYLERLQKKQLISLRL